MEIEHKIFHNDTVYYSQKYVDDLINKESTGITSMLSKSAEKEFDDWYMKLLNSSVTGRSDSFSSCSKRDLIRDKNVKKYLRIAWGKIFGDDNE